jgi:outer membrane lipoprotein-sorting protein
MVTKIKNWKWPAKLAIGLLFLLIGLGAIIGGNKGVPIQAADQIENHVSADTTTLSSNSDISKIKAVLLNSYQNYDSVSFKFNKWELIDGKKHLTNASVKVVQRPVPMVNMMMTSGMEGEKQYITQEISDGKQTFTYDEGRNWYFVRDTYISPDPKKMPAEAPENAVSVYENGTRIPSGGDVELVVHPELLAQNWMLNSQVSIGEVEKIAGREALRLDIFPAEAAKDKLGDKRVYWIDSQTGVILGSDIYHNGQKSESFILEDVVFNQEISKENFVFTAPQGVPDLNTVHASPFPE